MSTEIPLPDPPSLQGGLSPPWNSLCVGPLPPPHPPKTQAKPNIQNWGGGGRRSSDIVYAGVLRHCSCCRCLHCLALAVLCSSNFHLFGGLGLSRLWPGRLVGNHHALCMHGSIPNVSLTPPSTCPTHAFLHLPECAEWGLWSSVKYCLAIGQTILSSCRMQNEGSCPKSLGSEWPSSARAQENAVAQTPQAICHMPSRDLRSFSMTSSTSRSAGSPASLVEPTAHSYHSPVTTLHNSHFLVSTLWG